MPAPRNRNEFDFGTTFANLLAITRRYFDLAAHGAAPHRDCLNALGSTPHWVELDTGFADTVPSMMPANPAPPAEMPHNRTSGWPLHSPGERHDDDNNDNNNGPRR